MRSRSQIPFSDGFKLLGLFMCVLTFHLPQVSNRNAQASRFQTVEEWDEAARRVKRLPPSAFKQLPVAHRKRLQALGCTIPQVPSIPRLHNVIVGEFAHKGQKDWAVLCSKKGSSTLLLLWGGPVRCPDTLSSAQDIHALQGMGEGRIEFSWMISPADARDIAGHYQAYGGPAPPPVGHQGIDVAFLGKASVVSYCHEGKWLRLQGAD